MNDVIALNSAMRDVAGAGRLKTDNIIEIGSFRSEPRKQVLVEETIELRAFDTPVYLLPCDWQHTPDLASLLLTSSSS